ncbi:MAG: NitrOD5 domain-containing protein [Candidatus Bathyarchaeia archaeon]
MKSKNNNHVPSYGLDMDKLEMNFNNVLVEAVDEALNTLGASIKDALYYHLEATFSVKRETIYQNPAKFADGLERIFGLGSKFIEKMILDLISDKTECKISPEWQMKSFEENIQEMKKEFIAKKQQ